MPDFDFFEFLDRHVTRPRFKPPTDTSHYYPSEASVKFYDEHGDVTTVGKCMRAAYFRVVGGFERIGNSAYSEWIFRIGKAVEDILVEEAKQAGIWVDNNIKFYDPEYNISGEIDLLVAEPPDAIIIPYEIKSFYKYLAHREIMGNTKVKGRPKLDQMCQLLVYLNQFRDQFPYGRMAYFARDDNKRRTFKISIVDQGDLKYPCIDGEVFKLFTVNDILDRYKELDEYVKREEVPPGDYELRYNSVKIEDYFKKGKVSKTNYEKWTKGKLKDYEAVGDWQCRWCSYRHVCYDDIVDPPVE